MEGGDDAHGCWRGDFCRWLQKRGMDDGGLEDCICAKSLETYNDPCFPMHVVSAKLRNAIFHISSGRLRNSTMI